MNIKISYIIVAIISTSMFSKIKKNAFFHNRTLSPNIIWCKVQALVCVHGKLTKQSEEDFTTIISQSPATIVLRDFIMKCDGSFTINTSPAQINLSSSNNLHFIYLFNSVKETPRI